MLQRTTAVRSRKRSGGLIPSWRRQSSLGSRTTLLSRGGSGQGFDRASDRGLAEPQRETSANHCGSDSATALIQSKLTGQSRGLRLGRADRRAVIWTAGEPPRFVLGNGLASSRRLNGQHGQPASHARRTTAVRILGVAGRDQVRSGCLGDADRPSASQVALLSRGGSGSNFDRANHRGSVEPRRHAPANHRGSLQETGW
jgi:hypothetical protein